MQVSEVYLTYLLQDQIVSFSSPAARLMNQVKSAIILLIEVPSFIHCAIGYGRLVDVKVADVTPEKPFQHRLTKVIAFQKLRMILFDQDHTLQGGLC